MKNNVMKGLISLIVILFTNLAVFLILDDFNEAFWICYVFAMIAALITTGVEIFYTKKEALIFKYPVMAVTYLYSIVAIVVAVVTYNLLQDNLLPLFLINLFVFAFYLTVMLGTSIHNNTIKEQQEVRGRDIIAFKYVMGKIGIESHMITSDTMNHAWNVVKLDGHYYHVDTTWDDPVYDTAGKVEHEYLLLSDTKLKTLDYSGYDTRKYPANSKKYDNYFWQKVSSAFTYYKGYWYYVSNSGKIIKYNIPPYII